MSPIRPVVLSFLSVALACSVEPGGDGNMMVSTGETGTQTGDETGTGEGTGESTGEETTDDEAGTVDPDESGESGEPPLLDVGGGDTGAQDCPGPCEAVSPGEDADGLWLLHLSNDKLWRVWIEDGHSEPLCELGGGTTFTTLTFTRDNVLLASTGMALYEIDPCACTIEKRGDFPQSHAGIHGITPDDGNGLFGLSNAADALVRIDPVDASTEVVGPLGVDFDKHGATWSEDLGKILAINQPTNSLYAIAPDSGLAQLQTALEVVFGPVGMELHPEDGELYTCSGDLQLYRVDKQSGAMDEIGGPVGEGIAGCTNLGAPWQSGGDVCLPPEG